MKNISEDELFTIAQSIFDEEVRQETGDFNQLLLLRLTRSEQNRYIKKAKERLATSSPLQP